MSLSMQRIKEGKASGLCRNERWIASVLRRQQQCVEQASQGLRIQEGGPVIYAFGDP